jgi:predicted adenine nucleotide alpha hydrolase (AANH) superfamily ATPase
MRKLLLHSCCGPCSTAVIEKLLQDGNYDITVFYFNPNITEREEYEHRKSEQKRVIAELYPGLKFIEGNYDPREYYEVIHGYEGEPEGGFRCSLCFTLRLEETARYAKEHGFECFDTTLSVSPYKSYDTICAIARQLESKYGVEYLAGNYKKKDGYKRSIELSKQLDLYRQHFCGCEFSKGMASAFAKDLVNRNG